MERRSSPRRPVRRRVRVGSANESPLPSARLMDASASGALLSFPEPIGLPRGVRVCISVDASDGALHLMAEVVRVARGADFHTYVGIAVDRPQQATPSTEHDLARWRRWVDETCERPDSHRPTHAEMRHPTG